MKFSVTIHASAEPIVAGVVRAWLSIAPERLKNLVQERTPAGITIDSVLVQEEKTP